MANNGGNITFGIGFNVDKSGLNDLKKSLQDIQKATTKDLVGNLGGDEAKKALADVKRSASEIEQALRKAYNPTINATNISKFNQQLAKSGTSLNTVYQNFSKLGATGQTAFTQLASNILTTNVRLKETHSLLESMGQTMVNTVKWGIASSIMNTFTDSIQNAYNYIKVLDSSLTDIRIVTGQSREEMDRFAESANKAAQNLGRQTKDYTNAALSFYQQGLSEDEVAARTETTLKAANITGAGVSDMADQLTAVWNGFQVGIEDTENVVSKLAAVADTSASNMSQLATAMSKAASVANNMGVDVDQLSAQIATIIATTRQAPETVGNALKTIYARINDIKAGSDEAQVSLGNYTGKMARLGIQVLDQQGNLRDTGQVMEEIGNRWGTMTREQQIYLAQTMAGQRQMNNLIALFDNWDMYTKELNISLEAQGTLDRKNAIAMESLVAHVNQLTAAGEGLIQAFANGDSFKGFIDTGTLALNLLTNLVDSIGGGGNAILALGSIATSVFGNVISKEINALITNFQNAKFNAEQLNQVIQNTKTMASIEGITSNDAVQAMIEAQTETQKYYSVMSEAEINHQNNLIKELGLAEQQKMIWEANTNKAKEYAAAITGIDVKDIKLFDTNEENVENLNNLDTSLDYLKDNLRDTTESFEDFRRVAKTQKDLDTPYLNLVQLLVQLKSATGATTDQLQEYQEKLLNLDLSNANQVKTFIAESKQFIQDTAGSVQNLDKVLLNNGAKLDELSNTKIPNLRASLDEVNRTAKQAFDVQRVVNMISAAGQLASAFNSLSSIPQIFSDKDLSNGEKILKVTLNLSASLPMLLSAINKINKATGVTSSLINVIRTRQAAADAMQKAYNADILAERAIIDNSTKAHQLRIAAQEADKIAVEKATAAQDAFNASVLANPLTWLIAVLGAAVVAYSVYTDSVRKAAEEQAERAKTNAEAKEKILQDKEEQQKKVQQLYSAYKDLRSEYQNQESTLSQYQSAVSKILQQHGDHQNAVKALVSDYEQLDEMMLKVRQDAANQVIKASQEAQQAEQENIIKQIDVSNANLNAGSQFLKYQDLAQFLMPAPIPLLTKRDQINKNQLYYDTGIGTSQREADFFNSIMQTIGAEDRMSKSLFSTVGSFDIQSNIDAIISEYDQLEKILKEYADIQDNNIYKIFSGFLGSISQAVEKQQEALTTQQQAQADLIITQESNQLKAIENQEQFNKKYDEIVDQFVLKGIAAEDAAALATQKILSQAPELEDFVYNKNIQDFVKEQYSNINSEVQRQIDKLSTEEKAILFRTGFQVDSDTVVANVKMALQDAKQQINAEANEAIINLTDGISNLLIEKQGKKLTKDDKEKIEALVYAQGLTDQQRNRLLILTDENAALSQQIQALQEIRDIRSQENFNSAANAYSEAGDSLALESEALHQRVTLLEDRLEGYKEEISKAFERGQTNVILQTQQLINETQNEIDNLQRQIEDFDWTIHIDVDQVQSSILSGFRGEVQNLTEDSYLLAQAATSIGEGYKVAAEDVATLTSIFPEITQNAQITSDGLLQLDEEIVKQVLSGNTAILESDAEVTKNKLQGQVDILEAEIAYCDQRLAILDQVLAGEISQADAAKAITEAKAAFEENMANAAGKSWVNAQTQATQKNATSTNTVIQNLQKLGMTASAVSQAVAKALAGQVANYSPGGLRASSSSGGGFEESTSVSKFASQNNLGLNEATERIKQLQEERAAIQEERDNAQTLKNDYLELMAKTTKQTTEAITKADYASQGLGGSYDPTKDKSSKKSGGGGGKDKTKSADQIEKKKLKDTQIDKYHQLDRAIKRVEETIKDLDRAEGKTIRNGLSQTIDKQVAALEQEKGLYEQKIQLMQADLQLMQSELSALGVQFDAQGNIINYTALMIEYQTLYNQLLDEAKLLTGDSQEAKLKEAESVKLKLDNLKTQMNAYEQLQDKITDAGNAIEDLLDKQEQLRIKQFKIKIDWQLDKAQAERDWNKFRKDVIEKLKDDNYLGQAKIRLQDFFSYYTPDKGGIIQELTDHVNKTRRQAEIIENGGVSSIYGQNQAQALDDLKHYTDQLMKNLQDVQELAKEIQELYLDTIDKAKDAFDEQLDAYEQIDSIIEHDMNLIQMLQPEDNEQQLAHYYQLRAENNNQEIDFYRRQKDMWKDLMDSAQEGSKEWKKFRDNWMESISSLNSAVEAAVENLLDKYKNTIQQIIRSTKDQVLGGDWKRALDEWDRAKWLDDRYLDIETRATGVLDFIDDVNKAIEGAPLKQQQELLKFMNAEVDRLNNMTRLRQIDLDISNKKLEVLQKQMALEDAQESKTRLRLRRDSQGNYTYQYVADEDQINTREQELRDTLEELRQLAKVDVSDTIDAVEDKLTQFFDKAQELSETYYNNEEMLKEKLYELEDEYFGEEGYITLLGVDYNLMQAQLLEATGAQFSELYRQQREELAAFLGLNTDNAEDGSVWGSILTLIGADGGKIPSLLEVFTTEVIPDNFNKISEENQKLLFGSETGLNPSWDTALGNMSYAVGEMALHYGEAGQFIWNVTDQIILPAIASMINATAEYARDLQILQQIAGISFSDISNGIDYTIGETRTLIQDNGTLISTYLTEIQAIQGVVQQLQSLINGYDAARNAAIAAAAAAHDFWMTALGRTIDGSATSYTPSSAAGGSATSGGSTSSRSAGGGSTGGSGGNTTVTYSAAIQKPKTTSGGNTGATYYGSGSAGRAEGHYRRATVMATGGYTGEWVNGDSQGKLAFLHQKELVLNADDTKNILSAVDLVRGIMRSVSGLNMAMQDGLPTTGRFGALTNNNNNGMSQSVIINADFPAVSDAQEIKQAFNNLINIASQKASGNRRTY